MRASIFLASLFLVLISSTAFADSLQGRFGINGKVGALVPLQDDFVNSTSDSSEAVAAGGGFIFGLTRDLAAEIDVAHVPDLEMETSTGKAEASFTNISLGLQYRIVSENRLVPFFGAGVDFIKGELEHVSGAEYDLDWTVGGHVNAGLDYFVNRGIALTVEVRGIYAAEGDVENGSDLEVGEYDPTSIIATVGVRLMLPEAALR